MLSHLRHRLLRFLQPKSHPHPSVHVYRGGELGAAQLLPARAAGKRSEPLRDSKRAWHVLSELATRPLSMSSNFRTAHELIIRHAQEAKK